MGESIIYCIGVNGESILYYIGVPTPRREGTSVVFNRGRCEVY